MRAKLYSYKIVDASENKMCNGVINNATKRSIKSMTTESACLTGRNNLEKLMSYEVNLMRFIPKKLIKLSSLLTMTNELL